MRIILALGESGTYPAALAAASEWFPRRERALAIGIFNAGANMGAIITPMIVPMIALAMGWRGAFVVTGLFNIVWIVAWLVLYRRPREHPKLKPAELAYIESDPAEAQKPVAWRRLLTTRQAWAYMSGRFLIDPIWWTFLFWLPDFFHKRYGLDLKSFGPPLVAVYVLADVGSVVGGWYSSILLGRGRDRRPRTQAGDARLRAHRRSGHLRSCSADGLDRGPAHRTCLRRSPGLFGQPLFDARRSLPPLGGRLGRRARRLRRSGSAGC